MGLAAKYMRENTGEQNLGHRAPWSGRGRVLGTADQ